MRKVMLSHPTVFAPTARALLFAALAGMAACSRSDAPTSPEKTVVGPTARPGPPTIPTPAPSLGERIVIANADGSNARTLTNGGWPVWSPDGKSIAFHRDDYVRVIDVATGTERRVVDGGFPSWSPDGSRLAYVSGEGISIVDIDGRASTTCIRHGFRTDTYAPWDMGVGKPAWSPDGKQIAFEHAGDDDMQPAQIYVMNSDGSQVRRPTATGTGRFHAESDPAWSPNGSVVLFWRYGFGIATVPANGGPQTSLYSDFPTVAYGARPSWSPDGNRLAFATSRGAPVGPSIRIMGGNGGGTQVVIPSAYDASWSPDSRSIAFVTTASR